MKPNVLTAFYLVFSLAVAVACYLRPSQDDFDRYVYESLIRSARHQPLEEIYQIVKHESPRAEASSIMDSPSHLAQLEPLYAIRPLYLKLAGFLALRFSPEQSINLISAASMFLIAILCLQYTCSHLYSALLVIASGIIILGRLGTPDALSTLIVALSCVLILKDRLLLGIVLLMVSIWIRTDNVLVALTMLGWLVWNRKLAVGYATVLASLAAGSVEYINWLSGNYGWKVLLHYSFVGGRYPSEITAGITPMQYLRTFAVNAESLLPQISLFVLLGIAAWVIENSPDRKLLPPVLIAAVARYMLFPSGDVRYFGWACLLTGLVFIRALEMRSAPAVVEAFRLKEAAA